MDSLLFIHFLRTHNYRYMLSVLAAVLHSSWLLQSYAIGTTRSSCSGVSASLAHHVVPRVVSRPCVSKVGEPCSGGTTTSIVTTQDATLRQTEQRGVDLRTAFDDAYVRCITRVWLHCQHLLVAASSWYVLYTYVCTQISQRPIRSMLST